MPVPLRELSDRDVAKFKKKAELWSEEQAGIVKKLFKLLEVDNNATFGIFKLNHYPEKQREFEKVILRGVEKYFVLRHGDTLNKLKDRIAARPNGLGANKMGYIYSMRSFLAYDFKIVEAGDEDVTLYTEDKHPMIVKSPRYKIITNEKQ